MYRIFQLTWVDSCWNAIVEYVRVAIFYVTIAAFRYIDFLSCAVHRTMWYIPENAVLRTAFRRESSATMMWSTHMSVGSSFVHGGGRQVKMYVVYAGCCDLETSLSHMVLVLVSPVLSQLKNAIQTLNCRVYWTKHARSKQGSSVRCPTSLSCSSFKYRFEFMIGIFTLFHSAFMKIQITFQCWISRLVSFKCPHISVRGDSFTSLVLDSWFPFPVFELFDKVR